MLRRMIAISAALGVAATPCAAAELHDEAAAGARRSGAVLGAYVKLELTPARQAVRPATGFRLAAVHDYRDALSPRGPVFQADTLDLRLTGPAPALYLGHRPLTGKAAAALNASEGGGSRLDTIMLVGAGLLALGAGAALVLSAD